MNAERAEAYGRVMKLLSDMGPAKLQPGEQNLIREAADAMFFSTDFGDDAHAQMALDALREMAERLIESERWLFETADRLLHDVEACGPLAVEVEVLEPELAAY
jgi:hypothetical protein